MNGTPAEGDEPIPTTTTPPPTITSTPYNLLVDSLDAAIAKLGDDPSGFQPKAIQAEEASIIRSFAPKGLEEPFKQLHSILFPCLCRQNEEEETTTASAFVMGPRGSGKSLVLERCLAACRHQNPNAKFRKVFVHGIVSRGEDVPSVVYEIIRQLSEVAYSEGQSQQESPNKRRRQKDRDMLRLRRSAFTSNLSLLESTLKIAEVDRIPILLILDELDSFTDEGERQLLLYHLLDRVATPGSNLCLVGITSSFATLTLLEKRIRSRAEGTSKVVYVQPPASYEDLLEAMLYKLDSCSFQHDISDLLKQKELSHSENDVKGSIQSALQREFRLGKDLRWFSRCLASALSLFRFDVVIMMSPESNTLPRFEPRHLIEALEMMGGIISDNFASSGTQQPSLCMVNGIATDPRLQALLDMSELEVSLVLCARRLLRREAHKEEVNIPLTIERMLQEYQSFHRRTNKQRSLLLAAIRLLERGIFVPSMDHSGGGPLQYHVLQLHKNLDPYSLSRMPLHMPIETHRELGEALELKLLDCSTALSEWAKKV